ncbi:MAG: hypothetical protein V9E87_03170 [Gemmatimonadales bacterium]
MSRSRTAALAVALIAFAAPLRAQEKPTDAIMKAIAGTWKLDSTRSDSTPPGLAALLNPRPQRPAGGDPAAGGGDPAAAAGGGGGGRRGGGGGGGGGGGRGLGARMGGGGNVRVFLAEVRPLQTMVLKISESEVITADQTGFETTWKTDGKKHQVAQMEGGVIEFQGEWQGKVLLLEKSIPGAGSVTREFKPAKDGSLELTITLEVGKKVEQKLVYTRLP